MDSKVRRVQHQFLLFSFFLAILIFTFHACLPSKKIEPKEEAGAPPAGVYHTVLKGQTLWRIAYTYGVDLQIVVEANKIADPTQIEVGQKIFIPGAKKIIDVPIYKIPEKKVEMFPSAFKWPLNGKIISGYGLRNGRMHHGIDLEGTCDSLIYPAAAGIVVYSDNKIRGYGNMVIVQHDEEFSTIYAHNSKNLVSEGEEVEIGTPIAKVGSTGNASSPHLHFEIRKNNKSCDPLIFLPK